MNDASLTKQWIGFDQSKFKIGTCYELTVSDVLPPSLRPAWYKFVGRRVHAILYAVFQNTLKFKFLSTDSEGHGCYKWYERDVTIVDFMSNTITIRELT